MKECILEPYFLVLINGTPKGFFKSSRGLHQGDPLSPFLFSLVADGLNVIIKRAEGARLIEGCTVGDNQIMVSHLQFADDTIFFLKAKGVFIRRMEMCLQIFQAIYGLKVNLPKSCMVEIHLNDDRLSTLAQIMGYNVGV